ncbi:MAG: 50S ribosomal protein L33 [Candidatus Spechtbacteria bacterium]|uniref:Large ribosomal subunit protein bL33 n=1 Tax=Candidatus Spechtbacteria bacterium RIFCSPLOWO2_01_FULL_43_12 TaxID=1802162 RepID=A0A1G2HE96_9BACT|nr:50S ribosomal protein L33 [Candidatus Spechtbacteria bacterium]OGZ60802.1 MAG: 50S ribosomal protein L33 [Candidatus Spechtbacteria bacterium RIFCSPLOWO2_01_FULL_43_12]
MAQENIAKLKCSKCGNVNYWTSKNKKLIEKKLEFSKFCKWCRKHIKHTETKKKG